MSRPTKLAQIFTFGFWENVGGPPPNIHVVFEPRYLRAQKELEIEKKMAYIYVI